MIELADVLAVLVLLGGLTAIFGLFTVIVKWAGWV